MSVTPERREGSWSDAQVRSYNFAEGARYFRNKGPQRGRREPENAWHMRNELVSPSGVTVPISFSEQYNPHWLSVVIEPQAVDSPMWIYTFNPNLPLNEISMEAHEYLFERPKAFVVLQHIFTSNQRSFGEENVFAYDPAARLRFNIPNKILPALNYLFPNKNSAMEDMNVVIVEGLNSIPKSRQGQFIKDNVFNPNLS